MTQSTRTRLMRLPKHEQEIHVLENPLSSHDSGPASPTKSMGKGDDYDYQAPLTAITLLPNSRWLVVRRNLHRIRFMGMKDGGQQTQQLPDFYLGLQMTRELKRAQEEIKNVDKEENFHAIKQFALAMGKERKKTFDISHIKPDDSLIYDRLGEEPLPLQNLLYYFSKQDIQQGTVFWEFLNGVNQVMNLKRKRTVLVQRLQRLALTFAVIIYGWIGAMLFLLIVSVITTATRMNDPEVLWTEPAFDVYSDSLRALR